MRHHGWSGHSDAHYIISFVSVVDHISSNQYECGLGVTSDTEYELWTVLLLSCNTYSNWKEVSSSAMFAMIAMARVPMCWLMTDAWLETVHSFHLTASAVTSWSIEQPSGPEIISNFCYCIWHNTAEVKTLHVQCAHCQFFFNFQPSLQKSGGLLSLHYQYTVYSTLFLMILFCKHPPSEHTANKSWPIPMEYISFYEVNFKTFAKEEIKWKKM